MDKVLKKTVQVPERKQKAYLQVGQKLLLACHYENKTPSLERRIHVKRMDKQRRKNLQGPEKKLEAYLQDRHRNCFCLANTKIKHHHYVENFTCAFQVSAVLKDDIREEINKELAKMEHKRD